MENVFDEIRLLSQNCRFSDCSHTNEPNCAILAAVEAQSLDKDKYSNFIKLRKESEFYKMSEVEKRAKDRRFGKFIKKAKEGI
jgi:ribosome biogenesis GTPase